MTPIIVDTPVFVTGLTLAQLRQELKSRHPEYLTQTRSDRFINDAYLELCSEQSWPFLEATVSGPSPVTLADVKDVQSVTVNGSRLRYIDQRQFADNITSDLTTTGTPDLWYFTGDALSIYPVASGDVTVRYSKVPAELVADGDQALVPRRWCHLIVDLAWSYALAALGRFNESQAQRAVYDRGLMLMIESLMVRFYDGPEWVAPVEDA